jgi:hypothetical protein
MTAPLPPAGWYPDPYGQPGQRYWDGQQWHTPSPDIPATTIPASGQPPRRTSSGRPIAMIVAAGVVVVALGAAVMLPGSPLHRLLFHTNGSSPASAGVAGGSTGPGIPKVTVAGQPQNSQQGQAVCTKETGRDGYYVKIDEAAPDEADVELSTDASSIWFVSIKGFNGMELHYLPGVTDYGQASATKDGNNYVVTGTIAPAYGASSSTFPFEIDFSCP